MIQEIEFQVCSTQIKIIYRNLEDAIRVFLGGVNSQFCRSQNNAQNYLNLHVEVSDGASIDKKNPWCRPTLSTLLPSIPEEQQQLLLLLLLHTFVCLSAK